jgi:transcriptional regulator with GAF, ATPase, and Fis domain
LCARRHDQGSARLRDRRSARIQSRDGAGGARRHSTRRPALVDYDTEADLEAISQNAEQLALFRQLGQKSWIIVPLVVRERVLGAMTLAITEIQTAL